MKMKWPAKSDTITITCFISPLTVTLVGIVAGREGYQRKLLCLCCAHCLSEGVCLVQLGACLV